MVNVDIYEEPLTPSIDEILESVIDLPTALPVTPSIDEILESIIDLPTPLPKDNIEIPLLDSYDSLPQVDVNHSMFGLFYSHQSAPELDQNDCELSPNSIDLKYRRRNPDPNQKIWYEKKLYIGDEIDEALASKYLNSQKVYAYTLVNANDRICTLTTIENRKALLEAIDNKQIITRTAYDARTKRKQHSWNIIPKITNVIFKGKIYTGEDLKLARKNGSINPQIAYQHTLVDAKEGTPTQLTGEALADAIDDKTVIIRSAYNARVITKKRKKANPSPPKPPRTERVWHRKILYMGADLEAAIKNQILNTHDIHDKTLVDEKTGEPTLLDGHELNAARRNGSVITRCAFRTRNRRNKTKEMFLDTEESEDELTPPEPKRSKTQDSSTPNDGLIFNDTGRSISNIPQKSPVDIETRLGIDFSNEADDSPSKSSVPKRSLRSFSLFSSPGRQITNDQIVVPAPKKRADK